MTAAVNAQKTYSNPIVPGFYPDPSICRVGDDFYMVTSTFEYFPGVPVFHSTDLVNWEQIGHCLTRESQLPLQNCRPSGGIFAPTIRYHDGTYYMVTTNITGGGNFFVHTSDPSGEWSEPVWVAQTGIDPTLFFDVDGHVYFISTSRGKGIQLFEIDIKSGKQLSEPRSVWNGTGGRYPEAPHIYKKDGWYFLMLAEGGTEYGHMETIARSKSIFGPYRSNPANPILTHNKVETQRSPIQGTGHADLIQAKDGSWWMVALALRPIGPQHHILGRETFLAPVVWPEGGWPVVNGNGTIPLKLSAPLLPVHPFKEKPIRDDFNESTPGMEWNYLRNPVATNYSFTEKKGILRMRGSGVTLNEAGSPTFLGRRQQHFKFNATTSLEFLPQNENEEAGITVLMNNSHHYDLLIRHSSNQRVLVVRYTLGKLQYEEEEIALDPGNVELRVAGTRSYYTFLYSQNKDPFVPVGKADTRYLSSETAGGFTGVYIGLYTTGNGKRSASNADFHWFDYVGD